MKFKKRIEIAKEKKKHFKYVKIRSKVVTQIKERGLSHEREA